MLAKLSSQAAVSMRRDKWLMTCIMAEINGMKHFKRFMILSGLLTAASMIAPVAVMADNHHGERRYYDRDGHDYHYWSGDEDRQYRAYLVEQHRVYVPFVRVNARHRREYFKYRHAHGLKIEIR